MATRRQELAIEGELLVVDLCRCMRCGGGLRPLRKSTPCADVLCVECGTPALIRTRRSASTGSLPRKIMGSAWAPQFSLLCGAALHDLFVVLVGNRARDRVVYALPASVQDARLFRLRDALAPKLRSVGQQAFTYELEPFWPLFKRVVPKVEAAESIQVVHALPTLAQRERRRRSMAMLMRPSTSPSGDAIGMLAACPSRDSNIVQFGR